MRLHFRDVEVRAGQFALRLDQAIEGDAIGVFGASGSGKTTLLRLLAGLTGVMRGAVDLDGIDITSLPAERRAIGFVPQEGLLFPHLSVERNLRFSERSGEDFERLVDAFELRELLNRDCSGLSGGEQRRVAIARALLSKPRLLLMDEPLVGLDERLEERVIEHLLDLRRSERLPLVYVSHSPQQLVRLCDQTLVLQEGQVVRAGATRDLFVESMSPTWRLR